MQSYLSTLFSLSGRVALVTGGSSGLGAEIAVALAAAGARVALVARREARLREAVARIERDGGSASAIAADLARPGEARAVAGRAAEPFGAPDILVNAAGLNERSGAEAVSVEGWERTLSLNLAVPFFLAQALVPAMKERGWGRIINIGSLQSVRALPDSIPYGAAKGGIVQLTRAMAEAWSPDGVACNAIAPGLFPTELTAGIFAQPDKAAEMASRTAAGRNGRLEDLHGLAVFLASAGADYITGQTIFIDGGLTAK